MAQLWKALVAFAENPGLIPSTHMVAHNHLELQFQEMQYLHEGKTLIHITQVNLKKVQKNYTFLDMKYISQNI